MQKAPIYFVALILQTFIVYRISYGDGTPFAVIAQGLAKVSQTFSRLMFSSWGASYLGAFYMFYGLYIWIFSAVVFLGLPLIGNAQVLISEVAWMGTATNANDEWIELHNAGGSSVSLDGWTLGDGVALSIVLTGAVGAGEYVLLERTDDTTVPDVSAHLVYTGALANDGRTLTLRRSDGSTEDSVAGGTDWTTIGGNNVTKETPQWTGTAWVTGIPTPGSVNVNAGTTADENEENNTTTITETTSSSQSTVSTSRTNSGSGSSTQVPVKKVPPELALDVKAPRTAYVNQEVSFEVVPSGVGDTIARSLAYVWNFGDTYTGVGKKPTHMFTYPGEYIVVVEGVFAKQQTTARYEVTVLPVAFTLGMTGMGDVIIKNSAKYEVDLGGFTLSGVSTFTFPKHTILKAGGTITISKTRIGGGERVALYDTQRALVTSHGSPMEQVNATTYAKVPAIQVVAPKVKEELVSAEREEVEKKEEVPKETIIQIGSIKREEPKGIAGFFKNMFSFLGL